MLANKTHGQDAVADQQPDDLQHQIIGHQEDLQRQAEASMGGHSPSQNPSAPYFFMPDPMPARKAIDRQAAPSR